MKCALFRRRKRHDSTAVALAKAERVESEELLEEVRGQWPRIQALSRDVDKALRVNGFGEAAQQAMRRRHA